MYNEWIFSFDKKNNVSFSRYLDFWLFLSIDLGIIKIKLSQILVELMANFSDFF